MKSILLSIRPEWVAKILNEEKTIEVRKLFPKNYVGWVYLYCSKDKKNYLYWDWYDPPFVEKEWFVSNIPNIWDDDRKNINGPFNGKVVGRFWCDKVEEIETTYDEYRWGEEDYLTNELNPDKLYKQSCLDFEQLNDYLKDNIGYAIHISKLEIFDEKKELSEFNSWIVSEETHLLKKLTKAPQNYCYIEGELEE